MKDLNYPCKNCKHLFTSIFTSIDPPQCFYCNQPDYKYWELDPDYRGDGEQ